MKFLYFFFGLFFLATTIFAEQSSFLLTMNLPQESTHTLGAPIKIEVTITNVSGKEQILPTTEGLWFTGEQVCGLIPTTSAPDLDPNGQMPVGEPIKVLPEWKSESEYDLHMLCRIKEVGHYRFEYRFSDANGMNSAKPLQIDVNIVEPTGRTKLLMNPSSNAMNLTQSSASAKHRC